MLKKRGARTDPCGTPLWGIIACFLLPVPVVSVKLRLPTISMIMWTMCLATGCRWCCAAIQCRRLLWGRQTQLRPSFQPKSYPQCPVSAGWPDLWPTSRAENPPAPVGAMNWWMVQHERRGVSRDFKEDTQQRYGMVAVWVSQWLLWLRDRNY